MKRLLLASVYSLLAAWPVAAADLALKGRDIAPREVPVCGSGFYFGINTMGSAGAVSGSPVPGASIVQGELGATIGYTSTVGNCNAALPLNPFWFVEGRFDWTNLNGATQGLSLSGPIHLQQRVGYGTPAISSMLSAIPGLGSISTPSLPVLPTGVTSLTSIPYLYLAVNEQDVSSQFVGFATGRAWEVSPEIGIGMWTRLSNNVVVDVNAGYQIQTSGACFGGGLSGICPGLGNMWKAGVSFNF